jgi:hypothetical protein
VDAPLVIVRRKGALAPRAGRSRPARPSQPTRGDRRGEARFQLWLAAVAADQFVAVRLSGGRSGAVTQHAPSNPFAGRPPGT